MFALRNIGGAAAAVALSGCVTVQPTPVTTARVVSQAQADRTVGFVAPRPTGALSLEEAIARALKYNLDQRIARAEQAIAAGQLEQAGREILPTVMATAGYSTRDVDLTRRSRDSVTGGPSLANPFISSEQNHFVGQLGVTWNLLDFGLGYYNAKQQSDRVLIASERRRKAVHTLVQDVQVAFWRAYAAQALRSRIVEGVKLGEEALADSRQVEAEGLRSPLDALRYQRQILENLRTLEALDQDLSSAKLELARLINLPPGTEFELKEPEQAFPDDLLYVPVERLEEVAIASNADLREQHYNVRLARLEARKAIMRLFPKLSFSYSYNYDDDSYLIHNNWNDAGINLGYSLLNLYNLPLQKRLGELGVAMAEQKRVATTMAIISQVHLSRLQYANARQQFARADSLSQVEERIAEQMRNREAAAVQSKLETITATTSYVITMLRRYQALAGVYAAESRIQATLGADPGLANIDGLSLEALTAEVSRSVTRWREKVGPFEPAPPPRSVPTPAPLPARPAPSPPPAAGTPSGTPNPAAPAPKSAPPVPAAPGVMRNGPFSVSLGSFATAAGAEARLKSAAEVAGAAAQGLRPLVGRGNRALYTGFEGQAEAAAFCSVLRAASLNCELNRAPAKPRKRAKATSTEPAKSRDELLKQLRGPIYPTAGVH